MNEVRLPCPLCDVELIGRWGINEERRVVVVSVDVADPDRYDHQCQESARAVEAAVEAAADRQRIERHNAITDAFTEWVDTFIDQARCVTHADAFDDDDGGIHPGYLLCSGRFAGQFVHVEAFRVVSDGNGAFRYAGTIEHCRKSVDAIAHVQGAALGTTRFAGAEYVWAITPGVRDQ